MTGTRRIAFLDRDGTLIVEPPDEQIDSLDKFALVPGVIPALLRLRAAGFEFVMLSNQDGLGTPAFPRERFEPPQRLLLNILASQGIEFSEILICPHLATDGCDCRKPATGLIDALLADPTLDRTGSVVIGDRETDLELARKAGIPGLRIDPTDPDAWARIAGELTAPARRARVTRRTRETDIELSVDLDAEEPIEVSSGIGFFDHMLEQIARHGGFSLRLRCHGDLEVDEHHTVEDTALALGTALREALGDKRGIARYGFLLPMDEAQAQVALDLSGRPYFVFEGHFGREAVGGLPTELVPHFFRSLAESLGAALHLSVQGENTHHMVESLFKATGRALRQAKALEGRALPSTKGSL